MCRSRLKISLVYVYKPSIAFDVSDDCLSIDGPMTVKKFLDLRIQMSPTTLILDLWHTNLKSALSCHPVSIKKIPFSPSFG